MAKIFAALCLCLLVSEISGVFWDDLRVTYGAAPTEGFFTKLPRIVSDAVKEGWMGISTSCENDGMFSGYRYKLPTNDGLNLIFDKNGIIAGIQALLPHDEVMSPENPFRYDLVPMFQNETVNGKPHFVLTAYFVQPETICTIGRTVYDLLEQGTGTGIYFQNGDSSNAQISAPMNRTGASDEGWTDCECFPGMGLHNFFQVEKWQETGCTQIQPTQTTFNLDNELTGFVFQALGPSSNPQYETPPNLALIAIIGLNRIPQCILDANDAFGLSTFHVYLIDEPWDLKCVISG